MAEQRSQTELNAAIGALDHIGEPPIASLDATSARARACKRNFAKARAAVLAVHDWNFASAWETLTGAEDGNGRFAYRYALPPDCLVVREVEGLEENSWEVEADESGVLLSLSTDAGDPKIRFTRDTTRLAVWDALAFDLLELELAIRINAAVGKDKNLGAKLEAQIERKLRPAKRVDAKAQARGDTRRDTTWLASRRVGGSRGLR